MRASLVVVTAVLFVLSTNAFSAEPPKSDSERVKLFLDRWSENDAVPGAENWDRDLIAALKAKADIKGAAKGLASRLNLTEAQSLRLTRDWIQFIIVDGDYGLEDQEKSELQASTNADLMALSSELGHSSPLVAIVSAALSNTRCNVADYDKVMEGITDRIALGWVAITNSDCIDWSIAFARENPTSAAALWKLQEFALPPAESIALEEYLLSETVTAKLSASDLPTYLARMARNYAGATWEVGLVDEGLSVFESIPKETRVQVTTGKFSKQTLLLDGLTITIQQEYDTWDREPDYAAALYVAGRKDDARAILEASPTAAVVKKAFACGRLPRETAEADPACKAPVQTLSYDWMVLDYALSQPEADPYDLVEQIYGEGFSGLANSSSALWAGIIKDRLDEPNYRELGNKTASRWRPGHYQSDEDIKRAEAAAAVLRSALGPAFTERVSQIKAKLDAMIVRLGGDPNQLAETWTHQSISPAPTRFVAEKLPADIEPSGDPKPGDPRPPIEGVSPLPDGFWPVRVEKKGATVIAISVSQNIDQTGEVSRGGYWVHRSNDGGKTWERPLYTGLAELFPYLILPASNLSLIVDDKLQVEVEIQEIDTASIMYPPVALSLKRREKGLFIEIPLAELTKDSDGDAIPDIEEDRLLLDAHNPDTDGDGLSDGRDSMPNVARSQTPRSLDKPLGALLEKLFGVGFGAIIMSPDRPSSTDPVADMMKSMTVGEPVSRDRPIFIAGNPADFGGFRPERMMLVYRDSDLEKIATLTPDFHAVSLVPLVLNRAGDKGFVVWSAGWTGGTYRMTKQGDDWLFEQISGWIT